MNDCRTGKECVFDVALRVDALAPVDQLLQDQKLRLGHLLLIRCRGVGQTRQAGREGEMEDIGSGVKEGGRKRGKEE